MQENATVRSINKQLRELYGTNRNGLANFRVVFSDEQIEKRRAIKEVFSGPIFLRTEEGVQELPKYPWVRRRWILERWAPPEMTYHPDIISSREGDYVCLYIFQNQKTGDYLPPLFKVAQIVVKYVLNPPSHAELAQRDEEAWKKEDKDEEKRIYEKIREDYENTATKSDQMLIGFSNTKGLAEDE